jgi:dipeptidyl aminopeptidase/acylaminoacyl peptidase
MIYGYPIIKIAIEVLSLTFLDTYTYEDTKILCSMVSREDIEKYLNISSAGGGDFHPDGKKICFISNKSGVNQVYIYDTETQEEIKVSEGEDRCTNPHFLSNGDLLYLTDFGGNERWQIMIYREDGTRFRLTSFLEAKHNFAFATDDAIYLSANLLDNQRFDVFRFTFPLSDGQQEELLVEGEPFIPYSPRLVNDAGTKVLIARIKSNLANDLLEFDLAQKTSRTITSDFFGDHNSRFSPVSYIDDTTLLITSDHERDFLCLATLDTTSGVLTYLQGEEWNTGRTLLLDDRKSVIYSKNVDGSDRLFSGTIVDQRVEDVRRLTMPDTMGALASGDNRSYTRSFVKNRPEDQLLITFTSPTLPTNVYLLDIKHDQMMQITQEGEEFSGPDFIGMTLHRFASFDGIQVPYFVHTPKGEGPFPTIFVIHGGPEGQSRAGFSPQIQLLLSQGYMVVIPNIRGSNGYGRRYLALDDIEKRLDSIADIKALVEHLVAENELIDKRRLVVYGGSYGGFAVLSSITEYPDLFNAAVDIVGISNFVTFLKNTAEWRRRLREVEYGFLDKHAEFLESVSPSNKVHLVKTPTLIVQGDNDERVPLSESIQIYEKLQENGVASELLRFADEGHGVVKRKNQIIQYQTIFKFLEEHL